MKRLLAALLLVAAPALADEETVASSRRRDYPLSRLYASPADASRFGEPALGALFTYGRSLSRLAFASGEENDDAASRAVALRLVRKASPSVYWGFALSRYDEIDEANNTLITGDRKLETRLARLEAGPEAAYKMMDRVVLGLGLKYRQVATRPDAGKALNLTYPLLETALLVRSEWYEAEIAQRLLSYEQAVDDDKQRQFRREVTAAFRYHSSAAWTTGLRVVRNALPPCCLAPAARRMEYAVTAEIQTGELKSEVVVSHAPAHHGDGLHEIARQGLAYTGFHPLARAMTLQAGATVDRGAEKNSEVDVATASGTVDEADVEVLAWSVQTGVTFSL